LGPATATGINVIDILPTGVTPKTANSDVGFIDTLTAYHIGSLAYAQSAHFTLVVTIDSSVADGTVIANGVSVSGNETDPDITNNACTEYTKVIASKIVDPKTVQLIVDADGNGVTSPGDTLRYTNVITNTGSGPAIGVYFSDHPDINTTLVVGSVTIVPPVPLINISEGNSSSYTWVEVIIGTISSKQRHPILLIKHTV
jgi:uncharacterized repeat protein (TIGR01451 family)